MRNSPHLGNGPNGRKHSPTGGDVPRSAAARACQHHVPRLTSGRGAAKDRDRAVLRHGRIDGTRRRARPRDAAPDHEPISRRRPGSPSSAMAARSIVSSATRSWPSSVSRFVERTMRSAPCERRWNCVRALRRLNAQLEEGGVSLAIRIGVNTGEVFIIEQRCRDIGRGRRGERGGQARAGRRARRDHHRSVHGAAGAPRSPGRVAGAARAQGQEQASGGMATAWASPSIRRRLRATSTRQSLGERRKSPSSSPRWHARWTSEIASW